MRRIIVLFSLCIACGGEARKPDVPKVIGCIESLLKIMGETPDCRNRTRKIEELLAAQSECFEALTGNNAPSWMCPVDGGDD